MPQSAMPQSATPPQLRRRAAGRVIGGVAGGIADHLQVDVLRVRVAFVVLAALGGAGILAYGLLWVFTQPGDDAVAAPAGERRRAAGLALLGLAAAGVASILVDGRIGAVAAPVLVVALVWREADTSRVRRSRPGALTVARVLAGVTLVVLGLGVVVLAQVDLGAVRTGVLAVLATLLGVVLLSVPFWLRLGRELTAERRARIRTEERSEIASHLHDSVLQTLALIQKPAQQPQEVARLARAQERDLRAGLFDTQAPAGSSFAAELRRIAAEVEDDHGVAVRPVTVGDSAVSETSAAVLGATREAMVNAAKHSGADRVDVYAEVEEQGMSVFVRDRGQGFDPAKVAADRHGLQRSVRERMARHGGKAEVISSTGRGTEIQLSVPLERAPGRSGD